MSGFQSIANYPVRKKNRLEGFNYAENRIYFITVCTNPRRNLFWQRTGLNHAERLFSESVGADIIRPFVGLPLSDTGTIVEQSILAISDHYEWVHVNNYCIMPDHIHLLLFFYAAEDGWNKNMSSLSNVVGSMKRWVSKQLGWSPWQKSFYDRIIRNQKEYEAVYAYIDQNPLQWVLDHGDQDFESILETAAKIGKERQD